MFKSEKVVKPSEENLKQKISEYRDNEKKQFWKNELRKKRFHQLQTKNKEDFSFCHFKYSKMDPELIEKIKVWYGSEVTMENLFQFYSQILSDNIEEQHEGIIGIRKLLTSGDYELIQKIIDNRQVLTRIFKFAQCNEHPHLQLESIWSLANLSAGNTEQTSLLVQMNIIQIFVVFCNLEFVEIAEQAIWGLGNISADCNKFREIILNSEAIPKLFNFFDLCKEEDIKKKIVWVFSNLCIHRYEKEFYNEKIEMMLIKLIECFTEFSDQGTIIDSLLGISKYCKDSYYIELLTKEPFLKKLKFMYSTLCESLLGKDSLLKAINNILGALSYSEDAHAQLLIKYDFLAEFVLILNSDNQELILQVCWIISNLVIGPIEQIRTVFYYDHIIDKIFSMIYHQEKSMSVEAIWVISNLNKCRDIEIINKLLEKGLLDVFSDNMDLNVDPKKLILILEGIQHLLNFFDYYEGSNNSFIDKLLDTGFADKLENLQSHKSDLIYQKVKEMMQNYFEVE